MIAERFRQDVSIDWQLRAGIGIDRGKLLVRQLGLRGTGMNEVWAGTPVNTAAKLSGVAGPNEVAVSEKVFSDYQQSAKIRQRALLWSCGCEGSVRGGGDWTCPLDSQNIYGKVPPYPGIWGWISTMFTDCVGPGVRVHGAEFCEVVATRQRRNG